MKSVLFHTYVLCTVKMMMLPYCIDLHQIPFLHPLEEVYHYHSQEPISEVIITLWKLLEEEFSCICQLLFFCTTKDLSHHTDVTSYPKVQVRNSIVGSSSSKNDTHTNHIVAGMNKSSNSIHYEAVYKLITVNHGPETFHVALLYPMLVS